MPDPDDPKPPPPPVIGYHRPGRYAPEPAPAVPTGVQGLLGFLTWVAACAATYFSLSIFVTSSSGPLAGFIIMAGALGVVITLCVLVRTKYRWRGFLPGVLIGVGVGCLIPVGIVAVICAKG